MTAGDPEPGRAVWRPLGGPRGPGRKGRCVLPAPPIPAPAGSLPASLEGRVALLSVALLSRGHCGQASWWPSGGGWPLPGTSSSSSRLPRWTRSCPLCSLAPHEGSPLPPVDRALPHDGNQHSSAPGPALPQSPYPPGPFGPAPRTRGQTLGSCQHHMSGIFQIRANEHAHAGGRGTGDPAPPRSVSLCRGSPRTPGSTRDVLPLQRHRGRIPPGTGGSPVAVSQRRRQSVLMEGWKVTRRLGPSDNERQPAGNS